MFSDIFAVGDSFIAGAELAAETIPNFRKIISTKFGVIYDETGRIHNLDNLSNAGDILTYAEKLTSDTFGDMYAADKNFSFVKKVGDALGSTVHNHSFPGSSMGQILHQFILSIDTIKKSEKPFVIIGVTGKDRNTRFSNKGAKSILPFYRNTLYSKSEQRDLDEFNRLTMIFGDDSLSKLSQKTAQVYMMKHLLGDIPHIITDPYGDMIDKKMFTAWHTDVYNAVLDRLREVDARREYADKLWEINNTVYFPSSLGQIAKELGSNSKCLFWHPNERVQNIMAEQIIKYIENNYAK